VTDLALPTASVVIPARNAAGTIGDQLAALSTQEYPSDWEVIVADDHSRDGTAGIVSEWAPRLPRLSLVSAGPGQGSNAARNAGFTAAGGEVVLGCDADDVVAPGWMRVLAEALGHFDLVGGSLDEGTINSPEVMSWTPPTPIPWRLEAGFLRRPIGANYGVWRSVWKDLGGFDEAFRVGGSETEFFWRLQLASYRLGFAPHAMVFYRRRLTQRGLVRQYYGWGRGYAQLYKKFATDGGPPLRPTEWGRVWRRALRQTIHGDSPGRAAAFTGVAFRLGWLAGRIRYRVGRR
jgi:glycosyltransferase involved in cell wall biosynthesis